MTGRRAAGSEKRIWSDLVSFFSLYLPFIRFFLDFFRHFFIWIVEGTLVVLLRPPGFSVRKGWVLLLTFISGGDVCDCNGGDIYFFVCDNGRRHGIIVRLMFVIVM